MALKHIADVDTMPKFIVWSWVSLSDTKCCVRTSILPPCKGRHPRRLFGFSGKLICDKKCCATVKEIDLQPNVVEISLCMYHTARISVTSRIQRSACVQKKVNVEDKWARVFDHKWARVFWAQISACIWPQIINSAFISTTNEHMYSRTALFSCAQVFQAQLNAHVEERADGQKHAGGRESFHRWEPASGMKRLDFIAYTQRRHTLRCFVASTISSN